MPIEPGVRAAMLRYLAQVKGLASVGAVNDRAGREGLGFTLDINSPEFPKTYLLVIDPDTGHLLAYEEIFIGDTGSLDLKTPFVASYMVFLDAYYSD
jgi:hypothetical protein